MRIEQLQYILEIRDNHSITKTAEKYFISQQSLSKAIKALEQELGVSLYVYHNKKVSLTPEGLLVAEYAEQICKTTQTMQKELNKLKYKPSETQQVKILSFSALSNLLVSTSYNFFRAVNPNIRLSFQNINSLSVTEATELISMTDSDLIFLTVNKAVLDDFIKQIAPFINSYQIILEDIVSTITNKNLNVDRQEILDGLYGRIPGYNLAIFSFIPTAYYSKQPNYSVISSDTDFIKNLLSNQNILVTTPQLLGIKLFPQKEFRLLTLKSSYAVAHLVIYKKEPDALLEQYSLYIENYLKDMQETATGNLMK